MFTVHVRPSHACGPQVADKGTPDYCSGDDWVEVANVGTDGQTYNLSGWALCDSDGCGDNDAYVFDEVFLAPSQYLAVCHLAPVNLTNRRWIGSSDTITLYNSSGDAVDTTGALGGSGEVGKTWARQPDMTGAFSYTWAPTPNAAYAGPGSNTACDRLAREGLNCSACVDPSIDAATQTCSTTPSTAQSDFLLEEQALFGSRAPPSLWNRTAFLFRDETVWDIELLLSNQQWDRMRADPAAEAYEIGGVRVNGPSGPLGEWSNVGIRFKGYFGSLRMCLIGWQTCRKLSYKLKFDIVDAEQRFFGLKRLQLHASISDPSMMRERLAYSLFREMGVPTVRQTYSVVKRVQSDGSRTDRLGVYVLTEVLDGRWTDTNYRPGDGNLYKEAWPALDGKTDAQKDTYYKERLRTNAGADAWGGSGPDVQRLVDFSNALESASDDYTLTQVVREYTAARQWANFFAIDRAIDAWDGPSNFRELESGSPRAGWTHNFMMYEEDDTSATSREFHLVPWDMDNSFPGVASPDQPLGPRPAFDAPVCGPTEQASGDAGSSGCILCEAFSSTYGLSRSFPPSCFRLNRVFFGLGLRSHYMEAAANAMSGPLRLCRIRAKMERWRASIADAMAEDALAGLFPATESEELERYPWRVHYEYFRDTIVPAMLEFYRESVACGEGGSRYTPEQWGELYSTPVGQMQSIEDMAGSSWNGGGPRGGDGSGGWLIAVVVGVVASIGVTVGVVCACNRAKGQGGPAPPTHTQMAMSTSSSTVAMSTARAVETVLVQVPPGVSGGQEMLVNAPAGGQIVVKVPSNCTQFTVTVPADGTPVSRSISISVPVGLSFAPSLDGGAKVVDTHAGSAKLAGVQVGERVVTVNGAPIPSSDPVNEVVRMIKSSGETVTLWIPAVAVYA
jgi:hypothetical protein